MRAREIRAIEDSLQSQNVDPAAADFPLAITDMPIDATQRRIALGVMIAVLLVELAAAPFAYLPVAHIDSFIPVLQSVMCILHLITAALLFSQYSVRPRFATLAIASGFLFSGFFAFAQTLAFPGTYSAGVVIGDADTGVWLFVLWHTTFPVATIVYALTKNAKDVLSNRAPAACICVAVACVIAATGILTWLLLIGSDYLPRVFVGDGGTTIKARVFYINVYLWVLNSTALIVLFFRMRTILGLWLVVTLFAWWPMFLVPMYFTMVRFSIGWYVARCLSVAASSVLLAILMGESALLSARLASSLRLLRRERAERLATVEAATSAMAHEIRQPLAGIATMGAAGLNWLRAKPPNMEGVKASLTAMVEGTHHAEEIISGIAALFRRTRGERTLLQLNDVCQDVVKLLQQDVLANGISVKVHGQADLPLVRADHIQIHQVVLNLVRNAVDAVSNRPAGKRRLGLRTSSDGQTALLWVRDSGRGISEEGRKRIFDPFYTTKANGMGLGLAICRTIIEEHEGSLRLVETNSHGSVFEILLPVDGPHPAGNVHAAPGH
jgi:signal transduction histidine kinase